MTNKEFKNTIDRVLFFGGFKIVAKNYHYTGEVAVILVGLQKVEYNEQYFINVGFWLTAIGGDNIPLKIEKTHMYFRLERLFPDRRELIIRAGDLSAPEQPRASSLLSQMLADDFIPELISLSNSLDSLRCAYRNGILQSGLILREARELLHSNSQTN
jgi:hypothetical protein